jgi:transcriptional regulator with XRE-family HTH domain
MPRRKREDAAQMTPFGRWLEKGYTRLHYNLTGFAELIGLSHSTVSDWTTGKTKPRDSSVREIARALGVSEAEVHRALGRSGPPEGDLPEDVRRIRDVLLLLPPEGRAIVENTAHSVADLLLGGQDRGSGGDRAGEDRTEGQP